MTAEFKLNQFEIDLLEGKHGYPRQWAIQQQLQVGRFFGATDFVEVSQAHIMCDTESLGPAGVQHLEHLASHGKAQRTVVIPAVTDPRGMDFRVYKKFNQKEEFADLERRATTALESLGILMTDTCINYQTVVPPVYGEHIAFGDTGSVIYANSIFGARSNFEGGPAGLSAALTGRVPRYGYHLDEQRLATHHFEIEFQPRTLSDWGALGAAIGKKTGDYWCTPYISGIEGRPTSDELKHFGAALASYGSVPLYHIEGVTPEVLNRSDILKNLNDKPLAITQSDISELYSRSGVSSKVDVVVFAAPQLSLFEIQDISKKLSGQTVNETCELLIATSPENKAACDRFGITEAIEQSGAVILSGVCFYQMYARELAEANGWKTLVSNSAKLVNIIAGYGYEPIFATTAQCIEAAISGEL